MEIEEEFEQFLEDIKTEKDSFIYLDESDLEFDYSHCEIYKAHDSLEFEIKEYLHKICQENGLCGQTGLFTYTGQNVSEISNG